MLRTLKPRVVIPHINNNAESKGMLAKVLSARGSADPDTVKRWLAENGVQNVEVAGPQEFAKPLDIRLSQEAELQAA